MSRSPSPAVSALSVKIPPFWPADPQLWFAQVEAQFTTRGISSQRTKFDHVVASLSPEFATEIRDLILKPPDTDPYDKLKEQLVTRTTASQQKRLQQLIHLEELGDRTPSQLLRRMTQLLGDQATVDSSQFFLKELFLQRLPAHVCMVLASKESDSLEDLATLADRVMEVATPQLSTIDTSSLSTEVEQLRAEVATLKTHFKSFSPPPTFPRSSKRRSPSPARPRDGLCWYHARFAEKARKCQQPCSWQSGNGQAGR